MDSKLADSTTEFFKIENLVFELRYQQPGLVKWLAEFFWQMGFCSGPQKNDWKVACQKEPELVRKYRQSNLVQDCQVVSCFTRDGSFLSFPVVDTSDDQTTLLDLKTNCIIRIFRNKEIEILYGGTDQQLRRCVMRVIREIVSLHILQQGSLSLHGSSYESQGQGYLFLGRKRSGKTTQLLSGLQQLSARYISNDRSFVSGDLVKGMPSVVSVRQQTSPLFTEVFARQQKRQFHREYCVDEKQPAFDSHDNIKVSNKQFCSLANTKLTASAKLSTIFFPQYNSQQKQLAFIPLSSDDSISLIKESLLQGDTNQICPTVFEPFFPRLCLASSLQESVIEQVATKVNCYRVVVGTGQWINPHALPHQMSLVRSGRVA